MGLEGVRDSPADTVVTEQVVAQAQHKNARMSAASCAELTLGFCVRQGAPSPESRVPNPVHYPSLAFLSTTCTTSPLASLIVARSGISPGSVCVAQPKQGS